MKNRIARTFTLIVLAAALSPLCVAQSSFTGDVHRAANSDRSGRTHLSFNSELSNGRHENHLAMTMNIFGFSMSLSFTW
ncbi:MAG: hypothetical protein ABSE99_13705 [Terracidiphilus sp.]|jgi:hypothetical protein